MTGKRARGSQRFARRLTRPRRPGRRSGFTRTTSCRRRSRKFFFPNVAKWVARGQKVLADVGIDFLNGTENLTWALNRDHTVEYAKAVAETLERAYQRGYKLGGKAGAKAAVEKALKAIAEVLNQGKMFRGLP